jgi:hypothetical protein
MSLLHFQQPAFGEGMLLSMLRQCSAFISTPAGLSTPWNARTKALVMDGPMLVMYWHVGVA